MQTTENSLPFVFFQDQIDSCAERAADLQKIDHAGTDEKCSHDGGAVDKTVIDGLKVIHETNGIFIFHILEGVRVNDAEAGGSVSNSLIGSAGDDIGENNDKKHN